MPSVPLCLQLGLYQSYDVKRWEWLCDVCREYVGVCANHMDPPFKIQCPKCHARFDISDGGEVGASMAPGVTLYEFEAELVTPSRFELLRAG